jgi:glucosamine 6-phosphate synthetase-like amidotransferase/phosphosugar isomerase protein
MTIDPSSRIFPHEMLREIYEQPSAITRTLNYYLDLSGDVPAFREDVLAEVATLFRK